MGACDMLSLAEKIALGVFAGFLIWTYGFLPFLYSSQPFPRTQLAAVASAIFASVSAWAASKSAQANVYNTKAFERQLRNNTIDACTSAAIGLRSAINRALRIKVESAGDFKAPDLWAAYTDAWGKWTVFAQTFTVVQRYVDAGFGPKGPDNLLSDLLSELRPEFRTVNWALAEEKEYIFQARAKAIIDDIEAKLKAVPVAD